MAEYHIDFYCGCRLDQAGEDEWCEQHRHAPVIREGASLRTGDELGECFLEDALDLLFVGPANEVPAEYNVVLEACAEDHAVNGHWLGNPDLQEELHDLERRVEDMLGTAGWFVDWNDGYVIWRPTADNPVATYRDLIDIDEGT